MPVNKSKSAFKTISEAAEDLGVATHVLRFWETKFPQISPMKATGGRRYYRPDDMEILHIIKSYLYDKRYTIEGVQKLFKNHKLKDILGGEIMADFFDEEPKATETLPASYFPTTEIKEIIGSIKNLQNVLLKAAEE